MANETPEQILEAISTLRKQVESSTPDQAIIKKCNDFLDTAEDDNQKRVAEIKKVEKENEELKERLDSMEVEFARQSPGVKSDWKENQEYKFLNDWAKDGLVDAERKAALRTDNDVQGGFLAPVEMDAEVIKKITEISAVRTVARVRTIGAKSMEMPVRATIPAAEYEGEAEQGEESNSTYESETVTTFRLTYTAPITQDMLMNSNFDMESEMSSDAAEAFAFKEGNKFVLGTGSKQPSGFTVDSRVVAAALDSVNSGVIDADDVLLLQAELKTGYNPTYMLNRRTLAQIRIEKSTTGQYIWLPGINGVVSNTLGGMPYVIANDMPDIAVGAKPLALGDFMRGYTIVDRTGMSVIRDEFTNKRKAIVEFTYNRWNTGQVTLPEAIKLLNIKA